MPIKAFGIPSQLDIDNFPLTNELSLQDNYGFSVELKRMTGHVKNSDMWKT